MANRYWVGGTASWDATAGTKWAATSGGTGGETVPTVADDVFFDSASTGTCSISGTIAAKSINCTGFTGTISCPSTGTATVAGSITLVAGMNYTAINLNTTITGTGTLTTAGFAFGTLTIDGAGITVTLGSALSMATRTLTLTRGTFDTANFSVICGTFNGNNTNTRTVNLGSSTFEALLTAGFNIATSTGLTFNAGTSQINLSGASGTLSASSQTFNAVAFTSIVSTGTRSISGSNTINNLTIASSVGAAIRFTLSQDLTITGSVTCTNTSGTRRVFICSDTIGTPRTLTTATLSAPDCDFRDITLAGAAAGASPIRAGDLGGNSGINFPSAKTVYRVGTNTTWAGSTSWALTSGGGGSNDNFPLAQDTAIINNDTALTGTLAIAAYNLPALDCSNRTNAITLNYNTACDWYGSHRLGSGVTVTGTSAQTFLNRGTVDFACAGKTITFPINVSSVDGTLRLADAFSSSSTITVTRANSTFDANTFNLTCTAFSTSVLAAIVNMGSGLWTLSGSGTPWSIPSVATLNKGTADVLLSNNTTSGRLFAGGGKSYNKLTIGGTTSTSILDISGANSFSEIASTKTVAHTIRLIDSLGTIGTWSVAGSAGNLVTFLSSVAGTRRNFTLTNVTSGIDYLSIKDIGELNNNKFYVGLNSTNAGNNSNVYFSLAPFIGGGNMLMLFALA